MAGLDPAIHLCDIRFLQSCKMDTRVKPAYDEEIQEADRS
jgi:hypothetical protein